MGSTFLDLTNRVLRRINEVELTETNFVSTRGVQTLAKDCVLDAIREINQQKWEWPYHAIQHTQPLRIGAPEYIWPDDFKSVDWNSFQIRQNNDQNTWNTQLQLIDRNEWYKYSRDQDEDVSTGSRVPVCVFKSHGTGFGVTPSPDKEYILEYRYYRNEPVMSLLTDTTDIPTQFDNVITSGALYHLNLFRENPDGVTIAQNNFTAGIKNMYQILVGEISPYATSTVINFSGGSYYNSDNYKL